MLLERDLGPERADLKPVELAKATNDVRTTLLQGLGGGVLLLGAYFTWRQLQVSREGQITERFTKAIANIGDQALDVRLGGIYALERITKDSPADRATVAEVLSAYVRTHSPWPPRLEGQAVVESPLRDIPELRVRAPDVQAALTVLSRNKLHETAHPRLDLGQTDLRKAELFGFQLESADLEQAHLEGASLMYANLKKAYLREAQLTGAQLSYANLEGIFGPGSNFSGVSANKARLSGASLHNVSMEDAFLTDTDFTGAFLLDVSFRGSMMQGARFGGAKLFGCDLNARSLDGTDLRDAIVDNAVRWPYGLDVTSTGVIVKEEEPPI
jgi:uncharacterized protein YjbI with pentapeptide repeats